MAGLNLAVLLQARLDQTVVALVALPLDIRVAAAMLILPLAVFLNGGFRATLALLKSQNCVWHKSKTPFIGLVVSLLGEWI